MSKLVYDLRKFSFRSIVIGWECGVCIIFYMPKFVYALRSWVYANHEPVD